MSGLKKYDVVVNGYKTTFQYSDEDAKLRGLLGKDVAADKAAAEKKAAARKAAAEKKAAEKAAAERLAAEVAAGLKQGPAPENKQAPAPDNK